MDVQLYSTKFHYNDLIKICFGISFKDFVGIFHTAMKTPLKILTKTTKSTKIEKIMSH